MKTMLNSWGVPIFLFLIVTFAWSISFAGEANRISVAELQKLLNSKTSVVLIDVRTPQEFAEGYIPGAILMPLDTLNSVDKLPKGDKVVLYCRSGKRSQTALKILSDKGFKGLVDLEGGILAWKEAGGAVVTDKR